ncbi:hypothetical protein JTE90_008720 [Oedothorax gibbosus]|uniref:Cyclic nucleotide-binding domain-containing protein n=1 Tax=Oedothorax gibbosus TaxID=931172 RepID=A0AAV6UPR6_9ARAC|nr:hypothetical protein JTE90_008720 [Oedothorax gibbosus]
MSEQQKKSEQKVKVPKELENILLEYTIKVIVDEPDDVVSHAADYFAALKDGKNEKDAESELKDINENLGARCNRREAIVGESYNPEEEEDGEDEIEMFPKKDEDRKKILETVQDIFFFGNLDSESLNQVIDAMIPRKVDKAMVITRQGDDGDFFYVLGKGTFKAYSKDGDVDKVVKTYKDSGCFGELALLHNLPRDVTVKAVTDGQIWAVSRKTFKTLMVKIALEKSRKYMKLLDRVPELKSFNECEKLELCDALVPVSLKKDEILFNEGDEGNGMYFVVQGKVKVQSSTKKKGEETQEVGKGLYFGEMALQKKEPRAAGIVAAEDTKLAFLETDAFERLLGPVPTS